jgi:hypothetical protein
MMAGFNKRLPFNVAGISIPLPSGLNMVIVALAMLLVEFVLFAALVVRVAMKVPVVVGVPATLQVTVWLAGISAGCAQAIPDGDMVHPETDKPGGKLVISQLAFGASPLAIAVGMLAQVKLPL